MPNVKCGRCGKMMVKMPIYGQYRCKCGHTFAMGHFGEDKTVHMSKLPRTPTPRIALTGDGKPYPVS